MWSDSATELSEMREDVARFIRARDWGRYHAPVNVASAATVEAGELLELFQWRRSGDPLPDEVVAQAGSEMADVLHFSLCLVNAMGLRLEQDGMTLSQVLDEAGSRELGPKEAAEEVMVGASFLLMATRASTISREIAETLHEGSSDEAVIASVSILIESLAKCARSMGLDLSRELWEKNRFNEERYPPGTMPDVGY